VKSLVIVAVLAAAVAGASAAAPTPGTDISENWAGYTVADSAAAPVAFTRATATWKEPKLTCRAGASRSSVWVGLGGVNPDSGELEQLGTNANCVSGKPQYNAFYDVIPNPGVTVARFPVKAGDVIVVTLTSEQGGAKAGFTMKDLTTKLGFRGTLSVDPGARRSAEWIVEAPSGCNDAGCEQADLANFGTVSFSKVGVTGNGHAGTVLDPRWHATAESLRPALSQIEATGLSHGAVPVKLAPSGSSFEVEWRKRTAGS
jgi:hypothetical protein